MGFIRKALNAGTAGTVRPESTKQRYGRVSAGLPSQAQRSADGWSSLGRLLTSGKPKPARVTVTLTLACGHEQNGGGGCQIINGVGDPIYCGTCREYRTVTEHTENQPNGA